MATLRLRANGYDDYAEIPEVLMARCRVECRRTGRNWWQMFRCRECARAVPVGISFQKIGEIIADVLEPIDEIRLGGGATVLTNDLSVVRP